jgi:hypothetical protein
MIKKKVKKEIPTKEVFREDVSDLEIAKKMLKNKKIPILLIS